MNKNKLHLVLPELKHEAEAKAYILEHLDHHSDINGTHELNAYMKRYKEWVKRVKCYRNNEHLEAGHVASTTYFAIWLSDQKIVGMIDLRHDLNDYLKAIGGHI